MLQYVTRRLMLGALTALLVSLIIFSIMRIVPGDVVDAIISAEGSGGYSQERIEALREQLGLNRPLPVQYFVWMWDFVTLDWGKSLYNGADIWEQFKARIPITLQLSIMTVTLSVLAGLPTGVLMALYQDRWSDYVIRITSLMGLSVPNFWTGTMIILAGVLYFGWSPPLEYISPFEDFGGNLGQFIWPAVATAWVAQATQARMMRSTMLEVLRQDYIRTAHAKGLRYYVVVYRHAIKNAMIPVITVIGLNISVILGGSVIMETLFQLSGIGRYLIQAMGWYDYPVVQTLVLFFSIWIVLVNLLVDLTYGMLDPRIQYD
jgi:peptide/nickel transport system permease protein